MERARDSPKSIPKGKGKEEYESVSDFDESHTLVSLSTTEVFDHQLSSAPEQASPVSHKKKEPGNTSPERSPDVSSRRTSKTSTGSRKRKEKGASPSDGL